MMLNGIEKESWSPFRPGAASKGIVAVCREPAENVVVQQSNFFAHQSSAIERICMPCEKKFFENTEKKHVSCFGGAFLIPG